MAEVIAHPSAGALLAKHGSTAGGRRKARQELVDVMVEAARRQASRAARSIRCEQGDHRRLDVRYGPVGCSNDGSNCICECHDPEETKSV